MHVNVETYPDPITQAEQLAGLVADALSLALATKGQATLAVPGGTTPEAFLKNLSRQPLDWSRVFVMLTDERFVSETSDRSNTRLLRRTLLQNNAAKARLLPFYKAALAPEGVLNDLVAGIAPALPLDVCVLGMGTDMHTASLFPGADRLSDGLSDAAPVLLPMRAPNAPEPRLTLTAPVLKAAGHIHLLISGRAKHDALLKALEVTSAAMAPVRIVLDQPQTIVHYAP